MGVKRRWNRWKEMDENKEEGRKRREGGMKILRNYEDNEHEQIDAVDFMAPATARCSGRLFYPVTALGRDTAIGSRKSAGSTRW